jgi:hypothetical protein
VSSNIGEEEDPTSIIPLIIGIAIGVVFYCLFAILVARRRRGGRAGSRGASSRDTFKDIDFDDVDSSTPSLYQDFSGIKPTDGTAVGPAAPPAKPAKGAVGPAAPKPPKAAAAGSPSGGVYGALPRDGPSEGTGDIVYGTLGNNNTMPSAPKQPEVVYSALPS